VLLDNAVKYGAGPVTVTIAANGAGIALAVADAGPGLEAGEADRVFRRFARGSAAESASGAGLGLAIARGLAEAMGGSLEAVAEVPGARFVLTLRAAGDGG
jgi:two-component system sensor histidine kinase TctE